MLYNNLKPGFRKSIFLITIENYLKHVYLFSLKFKYSFLGTSKGYCAQYNGKICKKYINASILIWFNDTLENAGSEKNEIITTGLFDEMLPSFSKICRPAAEVIIIT